MRRPRPGARSITAIIVALAVAGGGLWLAIAGGTHSETGVPTHAGITSSASPTPGTYRLTIDLRHVEGKRVSGSPVRPKRLRPAAEAIRAVMTDLYTTGFVDPTRWEGGRFPMLEDLFTLRTRARVHRDLGALTIGSLATHLDAVAPGTTTLGVRFLVGTRPAVAIASVKFRGVAIAQGAELPIRHEGVYTLRRSDGDWRIASYKVRSHLPSVQDVERTSRKASGSPGVASTGTFFLLVIGSDARPGESPAATRGDSLHIVGVNPAKHVVSILGIPRDSFVPIPGIGTRKINEALFWGGPNLVVRTVEQLTGVSIDAYVLTGFKGFQDLVNAVGGIVVDVPYRMSDPYSHARFAPGKRHMNGRLALAFSRDRHDVPGGDFGRSVNQGRMLISALRQLKVDVAKNPASILNWIAAGARILQSDLSLSDMVEMLLSMPSLDPGRVENRVVSGTGATIGGLSVVRLGSAAHAMFRDLAADAIFNGRP